MSDSNSDFYNILREFLSIEKISACILGRDGKKVFEYFVSPEEEKSIKDELGVDRLKDIAASFTDYDVSDVNDISSNGPGKYRALAVRDSAGKVRLVLFLFTGSTDDALFDRQTRAVSDSLTMYCSLTSELSVRTEQVRKNEEDISSLEHSKRLFRYLSMLIDDISFKVPFDDAADDIVKQSALCVDFDLAVIIKAENGRVKTLKQFRPGDSASDVSLNGMEKKELPFMDGKTYTISSDSIISKEFKDFFEKCGIKAGIFIPIGEKEGDLYLCFLKTGGDKTWQSDEISFVRQAGAILRAKFDFIEYYTALTEIDDFVKTVFENSASAVAVYNAETKESLY